MTELNYWQKHGPRGRTRWGLSTAGRRNHWLHRWHEDYNRQMAHCPSCNRWRTVRFVEDVWESDSRHVRTLQCGICGFVWQHNLDQHDAVLYRSTDNSLPSRQRYKPLPYQKHRQDVYHPVR